MWQLCACDRILDLRQGNYWIKFRRSLSWLYILVQEYFPREHEYRTKRCRRPPEILLDICAPGRIGRVRGWKWRVRVPKSIPFDRLTTSLSQPLRCLHASSVPKKNLKRTRRWERIKVDGILRIYLDWTTPGLSRRSSVQSTGTFFRPLSRMETQREEMERKRKERSGEELLLPMLMI